LHEAKYRNEFKHLINKYDAAILRSKLKAVMRPDPHANENGSYFIRSLYFDTYDDKTLFDKLYGVPFRYKYRIRFYNHDVSNINLEKKKKVFSGTAKHSVPLTKAEAEKIICQDYDFLKNSGDAMKTEAYIDFTTERFVQKTVVDYTRYPFIYEHGNVRVTLDMDIRSPIGQIDVFNPDMPTVSVFSDEKCVLEIKYDEYLPEFIHKIVQIPNKRTSSMSKYAACRRFL
jgi:VTC domain.